jgi:predicted nucleotidyltransferase
MKELKMVTKIFRDRDYVQDKEGNIYQILGSIHPADQIFVIHKYRRISSNELPSLSKNIFIWTQKTTGDHFIRVLPRFSSQTVHESIQNHPYRQFSSLFQVPLIHLPRNLIQVFWSPSKCFEELYFLFERGTFPQKQKLDSIERETIEVCATLLEECNLQPNAIGITGSVLYHISHPQSDLDLVIYGKSETEKVIHWASKLPREGRGMRRWSISELYSLAEKITEKSGQNIEQCFEALYKKPILLRLNNRPVSIKFAPILFEIPLMPHYFPTSQFMANQSVTAIARIDNDDWGFYYPEIFFLTVEQIIQGSKIDPKKITRMIIFDHDYAGYYKRGDRVEIQGLLQQAIQVPELSTKSIIDTYQIAVGTRETYGDEFVRCLNIDEK